VTRRDLELRAARLAPHSRCMTPRGPRIVVAVDGNEMSVRVAKRWDPDHGFDGVETLHIEDVRA
jgi:hypothetical protein